MEFNASTIRRRIEELKLKFADHYVWGVRFDVPGLKVGDVFPISRVWTDGEPTDETLLGTACIQDTHLHCITSTNLYDGTCYIVCGEDMGYGQDCGEILIGECEVMAVVEDED